MYVMQFRYNFRGGLPTQRQDKLGQTKDIFGQGQAAGCVCRKEERSGVIGAGGGKWRIGLLQLGLGCVLMPLSLTLIVVKLARQ